MNRNSALLWLPKIQSLGLPTPKTVIVPYDHRKLVAILEGEAKSNDDGGLLAITTVACSKIGYPCFIRTDLSSVKHNGPKSYKVETQQDISRVLSRTIEDNEIKFWLEREGPQAIMVREFLNLDYSFTAFDGLPVAREWRIFSDGKKVLCFHPYWPEETIKFYGKEPKGWKTALKDHHKKPFNLGEIQQMALQATASCGGKWSVDFAMDKFCKWWLIDMATMNDSWHWPGCKNGKRGKS